MVGSGDRSAPSLAVAAVIGGIAGAAISGGFSYLNNKADVDAKLIELGVGILRTEPTKETGPLREWAIDVIQKRGDFNFSDAQRAVLLNQELPFRGPTFTGTPTTSNFTFTQPFPAMPAGEATLAPMPAPAPGGTTLAPMRAPNPAGVK